MGPTTIAKVKPKSLNITALQPNLATHTCDCRNLYQSSRRATYAGTAGVIFDFSDALEALALSSWSNAFLSIDTIRLEVIVAGRNKHKAGNAIACHSSVCRASSRGVHDFWLGILVLILSEQSCIIDKF